MRTALTLRERCINEVSASETTCGLRGGYGSRDHGSVTVVTDGFMIEITPPYRHMQVLVLSSAGMPPIKTVGDPGVHGASVVGIHAAGVKTPSFAAVAAATTGLAMDAQSGNGVMLMNGT